QPPPVVTPPPLVPAPPTGPPPPGRSKPPEPGETVPGATSRSSDTVQPPLAGVSVKIAGPPATPGPAANVTSQRSPLAVAVTVVWPVASAGASKTMCRDGFVPGTP